MLSTLEIVIIVCLSVMVIVSLWWFIIADRYREHLDGNLTITRGANTIYSHGKTVNFQCPVGKVIKVTSAHQICSNPDSNNFESTTLDPIAVGQGDGEYGSFNPKTTVDLKTSIGKVVNGKRTASWNFVPQNWPGSTEIPTKYCDGNIQLVCTYDCVPI